MTDVNNTIKGLECCARTTAEPNCEECPYFKDTANCSSEMMRDALALIKAQEPRVITREEVKTLVKDEVVYFQPNSVNPVRPRIVAGVSEIGITFSDGGCWTFWEYGKRFYLWTSPPTDEQREAVKWDG